MFRLVIYLQDLIHRTYYTGLGNLFSPNNRVRILATELFFLIVKMHYWFCQNFALDFINDFYFVVTDVVSLTVYTKKCLANCILPLTKKVWQQHIIITHITIVRYYWRQQKWKSKAKQKLLLYVYLLRWIHLNILKTLSVESDFNIFFCNS